MLYGREDRVRDPVLFFSCARRDPAGSPKRQTQTSKPWRHRCKPSSLTISTHYPDEPQFALLPASEDGVQCATCHGDGLLHSVSSRKEQVFRKVPEDLCQSCHNQERDPDCVAGYQSACLVFAEAPPEGQMIRGIQTTPRGRRTPPAPAAGP